MVAGLQVSIQERTSDYALRWFWNLRVCLVCPPRRNFDPLKGEMFGHGGLQAAPHWSNSGREVLMSFNLSARSAVSRGNPVSRKSHGFHFLFGTSYVTRLEAHEKGGS